MEEYTQITMDQWMQWKEEIREKLAETAGNFVYIGYRLKQIRDSGMYDGAADIFGFAEKEYGLGKSTVSRFIAINEKYSEGGNSLELKEEFRNYSSSKLAEMLTLPDSEIELITEKTTIREIREFKSFIAQEEKEYPQEEIPGQATFADYPGVIPGTEGAEAEKHGERQEAAEGSGQEAAAAGRETEPGEEEESGQKERTPLEKCIIDFFREKKEVLYRVMTDLGEDPLEHPDSNPDYKAAAERIAPSGQASHKKGLVFLFFYSWEIGIKYRVMGKPLPVSMTWPGMLELIRDIYRDYRKPGFWEALYGEPAQSQRKDQEAAEQKPERTPESRPETTGKESASAGSADGAKIPGETLKMQGAEPPEEERTEKGNPPEGPESQREERAVLEQAEESENPGILPGTGAVEISAERAEADGEEDETGGETGEDVQTAGEPGDDRAADRQEGAQATATDGNTGTESDAGHGAAEGGGCKEDPGVWKLSDNEIDAIWNIISDCIDDLEEFRDEYRWEYLDQIPAEDLKKAYRKAVDLAASMEMLLNARGGNHE